MIKLSHLYIKIKDTVYKDYSFITNMLSSNNTSDAIREHSDDYIIVDYETQSDIVNHKVTQGNIVPPKGSKIHVLRGSKFSMEDIRRDYKIKRDPADADYIIYHDITYQNFHSITPYYKYKTFIDEKNKTVWRVFSNTWNKEISIAECKMQISKSGFDVDINNLREIFTGDFCAFRDTDFYKNLLNGNHTVKPLVNENDLKIYSQNEVTLDLVEMIYNLNENNCEEEHMITNLMTLNQHNWRDYKGTLSFMFHVCNHRILKEMANHPSRYSKPVKEILNTFSCDLRGWGSRTDETCFQNEKDFNLGLEFASKYLNIKDVRYTNASELLERLNDKNVSLERFNTLFVNIVKITPKKYDDYVKVLNETLKEEEIEEMEDEENDEEEEDN